MYDSLSDLLWPLAILILCIVVLALVDRWVVILRRGLLRLRAGRLPPGRSPLCPLRVTAFAEIPELVRSRCGCGAPLQKVLEGPAPSGDRQLWLVIQGCPGCNQRTPTYFDVTGAQDRPRIGPSPLTPVPR
jgi:hypothetical protein